MQIHIRIGPAIGIQRLGTAGKAEAMQSRIKQLAGNVAGEWPPRPIGPFLSRTQSDNEQFRIETAKGSYRTGMPAGVAAANKGQMFGQPFTGGAVNGVVEAGMHGGDVSMAAMRLHWDIFCRVIDNFGDIGICWRLARQLAGEHAQHVRLWVDEPGSLQPLCPDFDPAINCQSISGVEVCHWPGQLTFSHIADVVIETFACELPPAYLAAMATSPKKPCWINLEYLTAESWAKECHGMASPHPTLALTKYFFFPGFVPATGGLLRERSLFESRESCVSTHQGEDFLSISLFCYETAPVGVLLDALSIAPQPMVCHVPPGKPLVVVASHLGDVGPWHHGNAFVAPLPFLPMDDYDHLLWRSDINFVRGEDSFVRAQWAGKPFVWQVYPQEDGAHLVKLEAFLRIYCAEMDDGLAETTRRMFSAWNTGVDVDIAWREFTAHLPEITAHNRRWAEQLALLPDLATTLVNFCSAKV